MIGRFVTADRVIQNWFDPQFLNRYTYTRNNPLTFIDPSGNISIDIEFPKDREATGVMTIRNDFGFEIGKFDVLGRGEGGRDQLQTNADTPTGEYEIGSVIDTSSWNQDSYGEVAVRLKPQSGKAKESGRSGILMHGGREATSDSSEDTDYRERWPDRNGLRATRGCIRASNKDIKLIASIIKEERAKRGTPMYKRMSKMFEQIGIKTDTRDILTITDKE